MVNACQRINAWLSGARRGCESLREFRRRTGLVCVLLVLSGCVGMSKADNERFQAVVAKNVSPGMSYIAALEHLVKAGFSCDERSAAPAVNCSRTRDTVLLYSCIQRVDLMTDTQRETVVKVTPQSIRCVGL